VPVAENPILDPGDFAAREDLADALTALRERRGMTVRDVARVANLPVATAGGYFSGRHLPPLASIDQFVRVLSHLGLPEHEVPAWVGAVNRLRRAPGRRPATALAPYRGLAAYQPEDAALFFGRERLTLDLVALAAARPTTPLVVIGSSGSGKSSLLRAGLAATLLARGGRVVITTPGADPRASLAHTIADEALARADVLVVDQFEEAFAAETTPDAAAGFFADLAALHDGGVVVVVGLRADFFDRALEVDLLARWLAENQMLVGPLSTDALRRVVIQPARAAGIEVEDSLVEVLVSESTAGSTPGGGLEAGALPLLSHALYVTWLAATGRRLTLAQYREVGGLAGAIAQTAEAVHASLTPEQLAVERGTLLRLVHVRDGFTDTRRPARTSWFAAPPESEVVAAYVEARLLTSDRGRLQLAHEALLTAWPRLRSWLEDDRDGLRTHGRLTEAAQQWLDADRDPELLYRGSALDTASGWVFGSEETPTLAEAEWEFIDQSQAAEARRVATRRHAARRLRVLAAGLGVLALSTGTLATVSVAQSSSAVRDRDLAVSRQLAVTAQSLAATDTALAGQVAVAAHLTADTVEARSALLSASGRDPVSRLVQSDGVINAVDVSPNGATVAVATETGHLLLWSTGTGPHQLAALPVAAGALYHVTFSADGTLLAASGDKGTLDVWRVSNPTHPVALNVQGAGILATLYGVTFSADARLLVAASADGTVQVWHTQAGGTFVHVASLPAFTGTVQAVALNSTGTVLAAAGTDGLIGLWDLTNPAQPVPLGAPFASANGKITSLDFSPDAKTLAAGSTDTFVHLWNLTDPTAPVAGLKLAGPASWVNDVRFNADGSLLAAASSDKRLWVWNATTGAITQSLAHPTTHHTDDWAPDGKDLYSGGADGLLREWAYPGATLSGFSSIPGQGVFGHNLLATATTDGIRLWDTSDPSRPTLLSLTPPPGRARLDGAIDISTTLGLAVAGDTTGALHFWDITDPVHPQYLKSVQAHTDWVDAVSFDRTGTRLAASSDDASITLWDLSHTIPDSPTARVGNLGGFVYAVSFSPDAHTLVASVLTGHVLVVDVSDLARPRTLGKALTGPTGYIYSAAFSPDGRTIAASGNDKTIWLWDVTDPARPTQLTAPLLWADGYATNVNFSPDGRYLAAGMTDGTVRLWNLTDRTAPERWASLEGISGNVYGVQFSPDGRYVSGAGADKTVRIWDTSLTQARATVCTSANRGLAMTRSEWDRIAGDVTLPTVCQ
jgi:WD40 repeat protein/transcriptional regulator with XRE-family HTH domain